MSGLQTRQVCSKLVSSSMYVGTSSSWALTRQRHVFLPLLLPLSRLSCFYIVDDARLLRAIQPKLDHVAVFVLNPATAGDCTRMNIVHAKHTHKTGGPGPKTEPPDGTRRKLVRLVVVLVQTVAMIPSFPASNPEYDQERCNDLWRKFVNSHTCVPGLIESVPCGSSPESGPSSPRG